MQPLDNYVFCNAATSTSVEITPYHNIRGDAVTIEISGNATGLSIVFEGKSDMNSTNWTAISAFNLSTLAVGTSASTNGIYSLIGAEGLQYIRVRIAAIAGGSVTVFGRMVSTGG